MTYEDVFGWLPEENVEVLERLIKKHNIKTVIEIGSFVGKSAVFFAERCQKVWTVDPFIADNEFPYSKFLKAPQLQEFKKNTSPYSNIKMLKMTSEKASKLDLTADLIYLDGSHEYEDVVNDIKWWKPKAKKVLCGDDYDEYWPGVIKAVDEIKANTNQRLWYIEKC